MRTREIAAGLRAGGEGGGERGDQGRGRGQREAIGFVDCAQQMVLRDMRDFVCEHRGELALALARKDETTVYADVAAGAREGVDARIGHDEEGVRIWLRSGVREQAIAETLYVFGDLRVFDDLDAAAQRAHEFGAHALFLQR